MVGGPHGPDHALRLGGERAPEVPHDRPVHVLLHVAQRGPGSVGEFQHQAARLGREVVERHDPVDDPQAQALLGRDAPCGHQQLLRRRRAHQPGEEPARSVVARQADVAEGGGDERVVRHDPQVGGERDGEAGAGRRPGQGGDDRLVQFRHPQGQRLLLLDQGGHGLVDRRRRLGRFAVSSAVRPHARDVAAGAEGAARAGEQDGAAARVRFEREQDAPQRRRQDVAQGVPLVRLVQRHRGDAVLEDAEELVRAGVDGDGGVVVHVADSPLVVARDDRCARPSLRETRSVATGVSPAGGGALRVAVASAGPDCPSVPSAAASPTAAGWTPSRALTCRTRFGYVSDHDEEPIPIQ